jgi:tRNA A-37 threonylcarbamoyl transferase component Bud32
VPDLLSCPNCAAIVVPKESGGFCPQCRTPLSESDVETILGASPGGVTGRLPAQSKSSDPRHPNSATSGWLSTSGAIDHGRFAPGTLLGGRYRIIQRLGGGGMGEVYRADDLKLGQPVALKFVPRDVDRDAARLTQLHTEVRMARQVSHPNVCRVYDIDEVEGQTFLSMEYVDGEDLASLLRRIGRFSVERALEISRQICAGLAAAHDRGVIHRDFKPANVMVDGAGSIRITDFGLAGASGEAIRAGTPAYMAPEQLAGGEATVRSDIYALGLVLYEVFTGRRAIDAKTIAELVRKREEAGITRPSEVVHELDPAVDRAVLRCLDRDPAARPPSARAVAAALPGGDPLAAALAAGETPSPEMVAAAGSTSALRPLPALVGIAGTLAALAAFAMLADKTMLTSRVPTSKPPEVLADRANEVMRTLGYTDPPVGVASGFVTAGDFIRYLRNYREALPSGALSTGRPAALVFWYRTSPRALVPAAETDRVSPTDPPLIESGMRSLRLDTEGRLIQFQAIAPETETPLSGVSPKADWDRVFALIDLKRADFNEVAPAWTPPNHSDERAAWEGPLPGWPDSKLRVEAAGYRGQLVYLKLVEPWTRPAVGESTQSTARRWTLGFIAIAVISVLLGAALVARHNLRKGRGDRSGALRIGALTFGAILAGRLVAGVHVLDPSRELGRFFEGVAWALFAGVTVWILYVALEPYVRRFWPTTLISWSRMLAGRIRDPQVGRDILIGVAAGTLVVLLDRIHTITPPFLGYPNPALDIPRMADLEGTRPMLGAVGVLVFNTAFNALWSLFGLVAVTLVVRRVWITAVVAVLFFTMTAGGLLEVRPLWFTGPVALTIMSLMVFVMLRFGLLATVVMFFVNFLLGPAALTLDTSKWFFGTSAAQLIAVAAIAVFGFYASRGGEPLFGRRLLD